MSRNLEHGICHDGIGCSLKFTYRFSFAPPDFLQQQSSGLCYATHIIIINGIVEENHGRPPQVA